MYIFEKLLEATSLNSYAKPHLKPLIASFLAIWSDHLNENTPNHVNTQKFKCVLKEFFYHNQKEHNFRADLLVNFS